MIPGRSSASGYYSQYFQVVLAWLGSSQNTTITSEGQSDITIRKPRLNYLIGSDGSALDVLHIEAKHRSSKSRSLSLGDEAVRNFLKCSWNKFCINPNETFAYNTNQNPSTKSSSSDKSRSDIQAWIELASWIRIQNALPSKGSKIELGSHRETFVKILEILSRSTNLSNFDQRSVLDFVSKVQWHFNQPSLLELRQTATNLVGEVFPDLDSEDECKAFASELLGEVFAEAAENPSPSLTFTQDLLQEKIRRFLENRRFKRYGRTSPERFDKSELCNQIVSAISLLDFEAAMIRLRNLRRIWGRLDPHSDNAKWLTILHGYLVIRRVIAFHGGNYFAKSLTVNSGRRGGFGVMGILDALRRISKEQSPYGAAASYVLGRLLGELAALQVEGSLDHQRTIVESFNCYAKLTEKVPIRDPIILPGSMSEIVDPDDLNPPKNAIDPIINFIPIPIRYRSNRGLDIAQLLLNRGSKSVGRLSRKYLIDSCIENLARLQRCGGNVGFQINASLVVAGAHLLSKQERLAKEAAQQTLARLSGLTKRDGVPRNKILEWSANCLAIICSCHGGNPEFIPEFEHFLQTVCDYHSQFGHFRFGLLDTAYVELARRFEMTPATFMSQIHG